MLKPILIPMAGDGELDSGAPLRARCAPRYVPSTATFHVHTGNNDTDNNAGNNDADNNEVLVLM